MLADTPSPHGSGVSLTAVGALSEGLRTDCYLCLAKILSGLKSTASTLSSAGVSAMTGAHVSPRRIRVGSAPPLLSIASKPAPGKSRSPAQLAVLKRKHPRPRMGAVDKVFWVFARRFWGAWKQSLVLVNPETVVRWHRAGFRLYWSLISRVRKQLGRKKLSTEVRGLILRMVAENPTWSPSSW